MKQAITSPESAINKKVEELQSQVNKQADIIAKQQRYLEHIDRRERECYLIVLGVPDNNESLDSLDKIWSTVRATCRIQSVGRLGRRGDGEERRRRPILVTVSSREDREGVLDVAKRLKSAGDECKTIFIKRDVHPGVREEWKRQRC